MPPYRRPVNMMFQSYALFPHMTVAGNVAFGLKQDGLPKDEIAARVDEMLALVQLAGFAGAQAGPAVRRPAPARRARALARQAPEGAAARRAARRARPQAARGDALRAEGAAARLQTTFVIVTHDQDEAMTVADRIAVMNRGQLAQVGTPVEIYERPNSRWVAGFVGDVNLIEARVTRGLSVVRHARARGHAAARRACAGRAGRRSRSRCGRRRSASRMRSRDGAMPENGAAGTVTDIGYLGTISLYKVRLDGGLVLKAAVMNEQRAVRAHDPCERPRVAVVDARRRRAAERT